MNKTNSNDNFELWNQSYFRPYLVQRIKKEKQLKKKITNSQLILEQQKLWLEQIQQELKVESILYSPLLSFQQQQKLSEMLTQTSIKKSKYAFLSTGFIYSIYYLTLKDKWIFYLLTKKNPSFFRRFSRSSLKYFLIPTTIFYTTYFICEKFLKGQVEEQLQKEGLYKNSNLELIFKTKKF